LSIGDNLYSIDDLDTVADSNYVQAGKIAEAFVTEMNKLPVPAKVAVDDLEKIGDLITVYETIGRKIGAVISGGEIDYDRVSKTILEDIKNERVKNITFDRID
jgi:ribosome biogenesis GTPase A